MNRFATCICVANKHIDANKAVDCSQMLTSAISKYWYKQFYKNTFFIFQALSLSEVVQHAYTIC